MDNYSLSNADVPRSIGERLLEFFWLFMVGVMMVLGGGGAALPERVVVVVDLLRWSTINNNSNHIKRALTKTSPSSTINRSLVVVFT